MKVWLNSAGADWIVPSIPEDVTLCSARGTRDAPVAEWVVGAVLDSYKGLAQFRRQQEKARWAPRMPRELAGSKALIVGYGSIGVAVEERLRPFVHGIEEIDDLLPRCRRRDRPASRHSRDGGAD